MSETHIVLGFEGEAARLEESNSVAYALLLAARGWRVSLLSLERGQADQAALTTTLARAGVPWLKLPHPATLARLALARFALAGSRLLPRPALVHARGCLTAAMAALSGQPYILDLPGFFVDQRIEAGRWLPRGPSASMGRRLERAVLRRARHVVAASERAAADLAAGQLGVRIDAGRVSVLEAAVDLDRYRPSEATEAATAEAGGDGAQRTLLVAGSASGLEDRAAVVAFARAARVLDARFRLRVVRFASPPFPAEDFAAWRAEAQAQGLGAELLATEAVQESALPEILAGATAAVLLLRRGYSCRALSPGFVARALASGKPVVVSAGLGGVSDLVARRGLGVVVGVEADDTGRRAGELVDLLAEEDLYARCRAAAVRHYSLSAAVARLEALYRDAG